jgi:hypothetical protein
VYHKTKWQMIAWEDSGPHKTNHEETTQKLCINDWTGTPTTIKYGPPGEPNIGLGFHLCPNGDQTHQYEHTYKSIQRLCRNVTIANLSEQEALQTVTQRLVPKLHYPLHLTSFTHQQSDKINTLIQQTFLPPMRRQTLTRCGAIRPNINGRDGFPQDIHYARPGSNTVYHKATQMG